MEPSGAAMSQQSDPDIRVKPGDMDEPRRRWRRSGVIPALAVALLALVALVLVQRDDLEGESSRVRAGEIAEIFIKAHNSRTPEEALALVAETALISMNPVFSVDELEKGIEWLEATEWAISSNGCTAARRPSGANGDEVQVSCPLTQENAWSVVLGLDPDTRSVLTVRVVSGQITAVFLSFAPMSFANDAVTRFEDWLEVTHADDLEKMYVYEQLPALTPESIRLWSRYTDEFVAAQRG